MADRPRAPPASISTTTHFSTQNCGIPVRCNTTHGLLTGMTALSTLSDSYWRIYRNILFYFFTLVQGQTPVTPPTLANTKENWMGEGTDHVICMAKYLFQYVLYWRWLAVDTFEANTLSLACSTSVRFCITLSPQFALQFDGNIEWIGHPRYSVNGTVPLRDLTTSNFDFGLKWAF